VVVCSTVPLVLNSGTVLLTQQLVIQAQSHIVAACSSFRFTLLSDADSLCKAE
jgi:hypothetical protein